MSRIQECRMSEKGINLNINPCFDFSILFNWTSLFPNLGESGVLFHFISNTSSCDPDLGPALFAFVPKMGC